jgi:hypothetical protein
MAAMVAKRGGTASGTDYFIRHLLDSQSAALRPETVEVLTEVVRRNARFPFSAPQAGIPARPRWLALVQLTRRGFRYYLLPARQAWDACLIRICSSVADLRTGNFVGGAVEFGLMERSRGANGAIL